jgi:hypothetical protein
MNIIRKLWVLAIASTVALALLAGCGDDDSNPGNPDTGVPPPPPPNPPVLPPPGGDGGPDTGPLSFPAYVKDQVENHTADNTLPADETAWGTLADDEAFVFPATFF